MFLVLLLRLGLLVTALYARQRGTSADIRDSCGDVGRFVFAITTHYVELLHSWDAGLVVVHDSSAIMALLHPEVFTGSRVRVEVETEGEYTRGS